MKPKPLDLGEIEKKLGEIEKKLDELIELLKINILVDWSVLPQIWIDSELSEKIDKINREVKQKK